MQPVVELFVLGVVSAFSTCAGACLPVLLAFLMGKKESAVGGFSGALLFSAARLAGFGVLGLLASLFGQVVIRGFGGLQDVLMIFGGLLVAALGIAMLAGVSWQPGCFAGRRLQNWWDLLLLGFAMAFIPCPPHLGVMAYAALASTHWLHGIGMALSFGVGNMVLLLVLGTAAGGLSGTIQNRWGSAWLRAACGGVMIILGLRLAAVTAPGFWA